MNNITEIYAGGALVALISLLFIVKYICAKLVDLIDGGGDETEEAAR